MAAYRSSATRKLTEILQSLADPGDDAARIGRGAHGRTDCHAPPTGGDEFFQPIELDAANGEGRQTNLGSHLA